MTRRLGWLFALAVILPAALLAALAVRSIRREEAFIEKRLAAGLTAEVLQLAASAAEELRRAEEELTRGIPGNVPGGFASWERETPLVGVPFLLTAAGRLAWPRSGQGAAEREFLLRHVEFLTGGQQIPVYTNIALAFQDQILRPGTDRSRQGSGQAPAEEQPPAAEGPAENQRAELAGAGAPPAEARPAGADEAKALAAPAREPLAAAGAEAEAAAPAAGPPPAEAPSREASRARLAETAQQAVSAFESDQEIRRKVYAEAQSKGQPPAPRNVSPSLAREGEGQEDSPPPSVFVSEQLRFPEIISGRQSGLIPRLLEERLWLLFWKRLEDGRIAGCQLEVGELRARLLAVLPPAATPERILTLLDERGEPLFAPAEAAPRDYRKPFVARELSELLPRWEAAAYLTDPALVTSRARLAGTILWILVAILTVSIAGGGTLVLRGLAAEVRLARQKTSFVANVSHELKTPLTSIRMYAEMLQEGRQRDPARRKRYLGIMVEESQRLTRLVNRVLDFARLEQGRRRYDFLPLDPEALCRGVLDNERPRLEKAGFVLSLDAEAWRREAGQAKVRGDEEALAQVLLNLLSNAEKYSGELKEITVELRRAAGRKSPGKGRAGERSTAGTRIRVLDRGRGVPPGAVRHLFKEFYRADDSLTSPVQGTGLGLAIARRIVRDHGGELAYLPRAGGGSIFQIELP